MLAGPTDGTGTALPCSDPDRPGAGRLGAEHSQGRVDHVVQFGCAACVADGLAVELATQDAAAAKIDAVGLGPT